MRGCSVIRYRRFSLSADIRHDSAANLITRNVYEDKRASFRAATPANRASDPCKQQRRLGEVHTCSAAFRGLLHFAAFGKL